MELYSRVLPSQTGFSGTNDKSVKEPLTEPSCSLTVFGYVDEVREEELYLFSPAGVSITQCVSGGIGWSDALQVFLLQVFINWSGVLFHTKQKQSQVTLAFILQPHKSALRRICVSVCKQWVREKRKELWKTFEKDVMLFSPSWNSC